MTEDQKFGWHHQLNGHEVEQALGDGEGQGSLECCSPWRHKESHRTERPNNIEDVRNPLCFQRMRKSCATPKLVAVSVNVSRFPFANWQALVNAINLVCWAKEMLGKGLLPRIYTGKTTA